MASTTTSGGEQSDTEISVKKDGEMDEQQQFKCANGTNPQVLQWYIELETDPILGQWFLSLKGENDWVFQAAQDGNNKFLLYRYDSKEPVSPIGIPLTQLESNELVYSATAKTCIESTPLTQLDTTNLPQSMIENTWISVNSRFFNAYQPDNRPSREQVVLESLDLPGYFLAYDGSGLQSSSSSVPAILVKEGDSNWDNRFITPIDSGQQDGTPHYIFPPIRAQKINKKWCQIC